MRKLVLRNKNQVKQDIISEISSLENGHYVHRLDVLLLIVHGCDAYEVAGIFGHSPRSVHNWINGINQYGLQFLRDGKKTGRPARLTPGQLEQLRHDILLSPSESGYKQNSWNGTLLSNYILQQYGILLKARRCQDLLHELRRNCMRP